jgi:sugar phosphate isomerase/epimerase
VHVHAKDCTVAGHTPSWCEIGKGSVDWPGQIAALRTDGYAGWLSLETHWAGPGGDKLQGSEICGRHLKALAG